MSVLREMSSTLEYAGLLRRAPELAGLPSGDGHPVVVAPGFLASDGSTLLLRRVLASKGHAVESWGLGRNLGSPELFDRYAAQIAARSEALGRPVSLIGWSLGGIASRWAAVCHPACVRLVITLGSPFRRDPRTRRVWPAYRLVSGVRPEDFTDEKLAAVAATPSVPATSIVSADDGIVDVAEAHQPPGPTSETVLIRGSHLGLGHNPDVYRIVADRLAQPEDAWRPTGGGWSQPADAARRCSTSSSSVVRALRPLVDGMT